ncbi:terpene synthase family protein [Rhizohabitans arisaemae]|uniref:terpene synthase family protein n=1 Tax=Rhizohabitans arisaemae TaxID=2720610 RepID=UPI0024B05E02|nr:terpene synthase family protein [Rhizohabitans arisaemae]
MLRLLNDWYNWLFAFDDAFAESARTGGRAGPISRAIPRLLSVLDEPDPRPGDDLFVQALRDLRFRVGRCSSPEQFDRWRTTVKEYLFAQVWEAANREADIVPGLGDYLVMRRITGATYTCLALIDVAGGYRVPADVWHHPDVQALRDIACDLIGWDNDLLSYAKERGSDRARHNLVTVIMEHAGCSTQSAMDEVARMHAGSIDSFAARKAAVERWAGTAEVRSFVTGLEHWVRGHIEFSTRSSRYQAL